MKTELKFNDDEIFILKSFSRASKDIRKRKILKIIEAIILPVALFIGCKIGNDGVVNLCIILIISKVFYDNYKEKKDFSESISSMATKVVSYIENNDKDRIYSTEKSA